MDCYLCDNEASQRCPRCGNPFCGDHGEDLCADCLNPVNAAPSGAFFRASLLALLLGSVLALWLLIRPPGLPGESTGVNVPEATPLPDEAVAAALAVAATAVAVALTPWEVMFNSFPKMVGNGVLPNSPFRYTSTRTHDPATPAGQAHDTCAVGAIVQTLLARAAPIALE